MCSYLQIDKDIKNEFDIEEEIVIKTQQLKIAFVINSNFCNTHNIHPTNR
jgi:hypothetical protein